MAFYERRSRRILPALLFMLAMVLTLSLAIDTPAATTAAAESTLATILFSSNVYFWADHSVSAANSAPLLHTWSLGVEEQFYIAFPILIFAARKVFGAQRIHATLFVVLGGSFIMSAVGAFIDGPFTFYLLPTRAWELLAGTLLAENVFPIPTTERSRNYSSAAGFALILLSALFYSKTLPFPGLAALPPCCGGLLIVAAGVTGSSVIGRMLSLRPVVFVGMISYSLYLWHAPLIVYQERTQFLYNAASSHIGQVVLIMAAVAAGAISWGLIERPFRNRNLVSTRAFWWFIGAGIAALLGESVAAIVLRGMPAG
jgi:peptidoglycan/LPS O-acetylase OafA/YrhL